jgi:nucleoside-diphosphate-sugar epimerase
VVNCVAGDPAAIVRNAEALFGAAGKLRRHVIFLSSIAVYGAATGRVDEDSPLLGDALGGYAAAKVRAEQLARGAGDVTILRPGCIYGMGSPQWTERIVGLLKYRRIGDLGAAGAGYSNLVHLWDVVAAVEAALRQGRSGCRVFNLAMPDAPDWNEYFRRLADALGSGPVAPTPEWRLQLEAKVLAAPLRVLEKVAPRISSNFRVPPAITPSLVRLWRQDMRVDSGRASAELGLSWTGLESGLREAMAGVRITPI